MDGEVYRALEARRTFRFELNGKGFFAKVHGGVGWFEIIALRLAVVKKLAKISRKIHDNGINHRDYYLCHFMMPDLPGPDSENLQLYLIDLHRAQLRRKTPLRWRIKDISGLYFSAMDAVVYRKDIFRFIKIYTNFVLEGGDAQGPFTTFVLVSDPGWAGLALPLRQASAGPTVQKMKSPTGAPYRDSIPRL